MALTICACYLNIKDFTGTAYSTSELIWESRKSMMNSGDSLYITKPIRNTASPGRVVQDLLYIANTPSPASTISVAYTGGGTAGAEVVTVVGSAISVQIESGVSTATQIRTAVLASPAAIALITVILSGTGSTVQVTASAANLTARYALLNLAETTTDGQLGIFTLNWNDGDNYGNIIFDPVQIPNQSVVDLSTILTISRG